MILSDKNMIGGADVSCGLRSVLILEDEPVIGLDLADELESRGYQVAGPFFASRDALSWLETFSPDVAVLDVHLRAGSSLEVARELRSRGVPFVFYSGGPSELETIVREFPDAPRIDKPSPPGALAAALHQASAAA